MTPASNPQSAAGANGALQPAPPAAGRWVGLAIKLALLVGIFAYLIHTKALDASTLTDLLHEWPWALLALALTVPATLAVALRFRLIARALGLEMTLRESISLNMVGLFFDLASAANGGDVVKLYYLGRAHPREKLGSVVLTVLVDRVMGFFALFVFALLLCVAGWREIAQSPQLEWTAALMVVLCAGGLFGFFVLVSESLERSPLRKRLMHVLPYHAALERMYENFASLRHHHKTMLHMLALSLVNHGVNCIGILCLGTGLTFKDPHGLPVPLPLMKAAIIMPMALFINTFGIAGGFGLGEGAFEWLYRVILNISGGNGLALAFHVVGVLFRLCGWPFWLFYKKHTPK